MKKKRKEKLGELLLDIAKYIITAVLIATWFSGTNEWKWYSYILPIVAVIVAVFAGLSLFEDNDKKRKENNYGSKYHVDFGNLYRFGWCRLLQT